MNARPLPSSVSTLVYIMETYLHRERVRYHKSLSPNSNSVYYMIPGPRFPYRLRISDHAESPSREFTRTADFHVLSPADIRAAQTAIETKVIRPLRMTRGT